MKTPVIIMLAAFGIMLAIVMFSLPPFGTWGNREVARYYIDRGAYETGSSAIVNSIVWDFRGYDTMGEETVLYTAALGVFLIMRRRSYGYYHKKHK